MDFFSIVALCGGLAMFLYGMEVMGDGLKNSSGGTLKAVLEKATKNTLLAVLTGTFATAIIQSSSATIVLTVGLLGAGMLNLKQAAGIVMGANIGTTVTAQIIRLMDIQADGNFFLTLFKPVTLAPLSMVAGILFIMFIKKRGTKSTGEMLMGFGLLFMGIINMSAAVAPLSESAAFADLLARVSNVPLLGILSGLVITVIVQSSSATVGMLQALSSTGAMTFRLIYPIIMGINLGTCVTTAAICSIGSSRDAKRTGVVHIVFNVLGTVLFMIVMTILYRVGSFPDLWYKTVNSGDIANFQTLFNLITAVVLIPFVNVLVGISRRIVPVSAAEAELDFSGMTVLDDKLFEIPSVALAQARRGIARMGELAQMNLAAAFGQLLDYSPERGERLNAVEDRLDAFTDQTENFLIKLSRLMEEPEDNKELNLLLQTVTDFERIGDYAKTLDALGARLKEDELAFSPAAQEELSVMRAAIAEITETTVRAFDTEDVALARCIEPLEEVIDDMVATLKDRHVQRLKDGKCTIGAGLIFIEALTNLGRAADQCSSIAVFLVGRVDEEVLDNHHAYLRELHKGQDADYAAALAQKRKQYLAPIENM